MFVIACAVALLALAVAVFAEGGGGGRALSEYWIQHGTDLRDEKKRQATLELLKKAKSAGVTHMVLGEPSMHRWDLVDVAYEARVKEFCRAAREAGIEIVPSIFPIGYGLRFLMHDINLAAGLPVRNAPFVVKGGLATPEAAAVPEMADAGFEKSRAGKLTHWRMDYPGEFSFVDREEKHSGKSSVRISAQRPLPAEAKGAVRVTQTVAVEPFKYYRLSLWMKTRDAEAEREDYVQIFSMGGKRRNTYYNMDVKPTQEWTRHECVFNTLEACEIELSVGVTEYKGGTVWFDDVAVEPAGLLNIVRRDATPLVVTSMDAKTVYKEGRDFESVRDAGFTATSLGDCRHEAPALKLTKKSRIKGRKVLVSYYHAMRIYNDQIGLSIEEPRLYEMMDRQMELVTRLWPSSTFFMSADEIRVSGWEVQADGANLSPSGLLARYMKRSLDIIRRAQAAGAALHLVGYVHAVSQRAAVRRGGALLPGQRDVLRVLEGTAAGGADCELVLAGQTQPGVVPGARAQADNVRVLRHGRPQGQHRQLDEGDGRCRRGRGAHVHAVVDWTRADEGVLRTCAHVRPVGAGAESLARRHRREGEIASDGVLYRRVRAMTADRALACASAVKTLIVDRGERNLKKRYLIL